ncbi:ras and ef-hand domain-containing protein [Anaeramoeba flamelloides]|nr:ras and ef-hand domain-containing protein [Anaeramoeba flamelloides]
MSYKNCPFEIEGKKIDLRIWDTAGQERYRSINRSYFQGTCGALLVYDITSIHSFETLPYWIKEIQEYAPENVQMVLVGNKIDLVDDRKVSTEMGEKFANDNQLDICETSAKTAENVRDAFELCIKKVLDSVERGVFKLNEDQIGLRQRVELLKHEENETGKKKKKEGCC